MSLHLRIRDQRWLAMCDRSGCTEHIVADEGTAEQQRAGLDVSAQMLGWVRAAEAGDFCALHAVDVPPPMVPRDEQCQRSAWCVARVAHPGECRAIGKRAVSSKETGPQQAAKRRY